MGQSTNSLLQSAKPRAKAIQMNESIEHQALAQYLVDVAKRRDRQSFTELFKFFAPKIQRIAASKYGNEVLASEVVQETMTNVWRKAHLFDTSKGSPTTWVYTVMRNVTFDLLRKIKAKKEDNLSDDFWPMVEGIAADDEKSGFSDHLASKEVLACIDKLPENQQSVIKGFYFMEMSQEQLAVHLDIPLGTVKSRLRLALAKLKQHIGDKND
ncbi:sigma-70 family RNA polymerase sigma factor [Thalassotalea euphylliae]|uniref:Sigma-70 family RNA polymerase sigma factor n=2 Tax=Thalassotalea euphylliae TaxID=1655234 RepID=A0A3E0TQW3_9GAMM|nr:sigma-70 family RNA polymerase sigma factor [Thalassotalea euphylliae]